MIGFMLFIIAITLVCIADGVWTIAKDLGAIRRMHEEREQSGEAG